MTPVARWIRCTILHSWAWVQDDDPDLLVYWKHCPTCGRRWSARPTLYTVVELLLLGAFLLLAWAFLAQLAMGPNG